MFLFNSRGVSPFWYILCVRVSLVCGKEEEEDGGEKDVTRWHFWNNKVTACRWQLSLVLSMSPCNYCAILPISLSSQTTLKEKREKISTLSHLLLLLPCCVWAPISSGPKKKMEQHEQKNECWYLLSLGCEDALHNLSLFLGHDGWWWNENGQSLQVELVEL